MGAWCYSGRVVNINFQSPWFYSGQDDGVMKRRNGGIIVDPPVLPVTKLLFFTIPDFTRFFDPCNPTLNLITEFYEISYIIFSYS